jgi:hypothetical protein
MFKKETDMEQPRQYSDEPANAARAVKDDNSRALDEEPEVEEESAEAMNSDVPQPPDDSKTTEGQPS